VSNRRFLLDAETISGYNMPVSNGIDLECKIVHSSAFIVHGSQPMHNHKAMPDKIGKMRKRINIFTKSEKSVESVANTKNRAIIFVLNFAKQSQFAKRPNEHKHIYHKGL